MTDYKKLLNTVQNWENASYDDVLEFKNWVATQIPDMPRGQDIKMQITGSVRGGEIVCEVYVTGLRAKWHLLLCQNVFQNLYVLDIGPCDEPLCGCNN